MKSEACAYLGFSAGFNSAVLSELSKFLLSIGFGVISFIAVSPVKSFTSGSKTLSYIFFFFAGEKLGLRLGNSSVFIECIRRCIRWITCDYLLMLWHSRPRSFFFGIAASMNGKLCFIFYYCLSNFFSSFGLTFIIFCRGVKPLLLSGDELLLMLTGNFIAGSGSLVSIKS